MCTILQSCLCFATRQIAGYEHFDLYIQFVPTLLPTKHDYFYQTAIATV